MKKYMWGVALTAALGVGLTGAALAADMPLKAPPVAGYYNWSGIYIGANAGQGWANETWDFVTGYNAFLNTRPKGALAGGQIGFNSQYQNWVMGVEVTGDWSGLSNTKIIPGFVNPVTTKLRDLETLTARLGYAINNVLFYAKAGGATGVVSVLVASPSPTSAYERERLFGTTVGGGIEYGLTHNIVLGVEYDFTQLYRGVYNAPISTGGTLPFHATKAFEVQSVVGRLSYKF